MAGGRLQTNVSINDPSPASIVVQARTASHTIYIQKIVYSQSVLVPGTVLSFIDSITGVSLGLMSIMPSAIVQTTYTMDFGLEDPSAAGTPLSKGAHLVLSIISGGVAGRLLVKAYQLPLFVVAAYVAPATAGFTK